MGGHMPPVENPVYGLMAEFESAQALVDAADKAREFGYKEMDGYSPFPIPEMDHALGIKNTILPWFVFAGGIIGCLAGFGMQYYSAVIHYPLNIGGRPANSWPMFIPITFEFTILFSSLTAVFGMLLMNGFPQHYHPVFNVPSFSKASVDGFFLCIESNDAKFDITETREFLNSLNPIEVNEVAS